jgi:hypothetical protein
MKETNNPRFHGFRLPTTTPIPDEVFDDLLADLSGAEVKVLLYICRRTYGFKKESDNISFKQICRGITTRQGKVLDRGTGLSVSTAQVAIKALTHKGIIVATRRSSEKKGNEATTYRLKFFDPYAENRYRGLPKIDKGLYRKSATQQTEEQQTERQQTVTNGAKKPWIQQVADLTQPKEKTQYVAQYILDTLGDQQSRRFYTLVAAKVPESVIRKTLAEIKADGAKYPERVFTHRIKLYALQQWKKKFVEQF